jgi:tRNA pseudouridine38-40 synthase
MNRYFIKLAYKGKNYHGWQIQENAHTVQAEVNEKLSTLVGEQINVVGCGRTDTGVHARNFFAHFDIASLGMNENQLVYKLDRFLPADVAIFDIFKVKPENHARFSALSRTYKYFISRKKDPFATDFSYHYHGPLDLDGMKFSCASLLGSKDFTCFSKLHTQTSNNICDIKHATWQELDNKLIFTITADRFLRNMVRAIVGTLIEIGQGKLKSADMKSIIDSKDRSQAGFSVPAEGLVLEEVKYDFITDHSLI